MHTNTICTSAWDEDIVYAHGNMGVTCVTSCGGSTSQGLGCSPIKVVRELGSERSHIALIYSNVNLVSAYIDEALSTNKTSRLVISREDRKRFYPRRD